MLMCNEAINLVDDKHHSYEQFSALFRVLALAQIVREHVESLCQRLEPLFGIAHGTAYLPRDSLTAHRAFTVI